MYGKFLVEGDKLVRELLTSNFKVDAIYGMKGWHPEASGADRGSKIPFTEISESDLAKISTHESPNQVVAIAEIPAVEIRNLQSAIRNLVVVCDHLNDPGNAGTIIRTADWFGIETVIFSENSVDVYNPKVVSSAKGSLFRVNCLYADLKALFEANKDKKVYGTFMEGGSIYKTELQQNAFIVIGNEANGINDDLLPYIADKVSIPAFGKAESLNAAMAAGIIMSEFKRGTV